jgi:hypothetical protein
MFLAAVKRYQHPPAKRWVLARRYSSDMDRYEMSNGHI